MEDKNEEIEEVMDEAEVDPEWIKNAEEKLPTDNEKYKLTMYLSTDGKHTVNIEVDDPSARRIAVKKAMELYDYILARYGTKQAQAVKEYSANGQKKEEVNQDTCKHELTKFAESKTEKNPGRWFKSCRACGKFLGWQM